MDDLMIIDGINSEVLSEQLKRITAFQKAVQTQFTQSVDFGVIPGTKKPTLLKPGAEKICMLLGLKSKFEIVESTRDFENGFFQYQIKCQLIKNINGNDEVITEGIGSCNTMERKYQKSEPCDIDNTVLKMAKKRALVDAALMVGSLSNVFTQDIEDMDLDGESYRNSKTYYTDTSGKISQAQAKRMFALAKGDNDIVKEAMEAYGYKGASSDVKKVDYNAICDYIDKLVTKPDAVKKSQEKEVVSGLTEEERAALPFEV
ncbi:MAG: hypothetical protein SOZ22_00045 [Ezakiella sp.]|nr:hypothetical protein [Ezakiella sp.]